MKASTTPERGGGGLLIAAGPPAGRVGVPAAETGLAAKEAERLGRLALRKGELAEALALLQLALARFEADGRSEQAGPALIALGEVHLAAGRLEEAQTSFERALAAFSSLDDRAALARARVRLVEVAVKGGRLAEAEALLSLASPALDRRSLDFARWLDVAGLLHYARIELPEALALAKRSVRLFTRSACEPQDLSSACRLAGLAILAQGRPRAAEGWFRRALALARRARSRVAERLSVSCLARNALERGSVRRAASWVRKGRVLAARANDPRGLARSHEDLAMIETLTGRYRAAERHLRAGLELRTRLSDRVGELGARQALAFLAILRGDAGLAERLTEEAGDLSRCVHLRGQDHVQRKLEAENHLLAGRPGEAVPLLEEASRELEAAGAERAEFAFVLGRARAALGNRARARELFAEVLEALRTQRHGYLAGEAHAELARLARLDGDRAAAREALRHGLRAIGRERFLRPRLALTLEEAELALEEGDRAALARALRRGRVLARRLGARELSRRLEELRRAAARGARSPAAAGAEGGERAIEARLARSLASRASLKEAAAPLLAEALRRARASRAFLVARDGGRASIVARLPPEAAPPRDLERLLRSVRGEARRIALRGRRWLVLPADDGSSGGGALALCREARAGAFSRAGEGRLAPLAALAGVLLAIRHRERLARRRARRAGPAGARDGPPAGDPPAACGGAVAGDGHGSAAMELGLVGGSEAVRKLRADLAAAASSSLPVLIVGESGTGKDLVARAIHEGSERRQGPFLALNCAALPDSLLESELFGHERGAFTGASETRQGLFEAASGGTLFLDEIAEMSPRMQGALLRAIEEKKVRRVGGLGSRPVDVRFLAASSQDLLERLEGGRFRSDLYYRLAALTISVPPLRARLEDLPELLSLLVRRTAAREGVPEVTFARGAVARLARHGFPGNVRELEHLVARALLFAPGPTIPEALVDKLLQAREAPLAAPLEGSPPLPYAEAKAEFRRRYVSQLLSLSNGNVTRAAARAGLRRQAFQRLLREQDFRRASFGDATKP